MSLNQRGAALQELLEVTNFRKKVHDIVGNWKKEKQKTKSFSETTRVDLPESSVQSQ